MKKFISGFIIGSLIFSSIGVFAATKYADAYKASFPVYVNGVEFKGTTGEILVVDGRTYLPLVDMGNALGVNVKWNNTLKQVDVGSSFTQPQTNSNVTSESNKQSTTPSQTNTQSQTESKSQSKVDNSAALEELNIKYGTMFMERYNEKIDVGLLYDNKILSYRGGLDIGYRDYYDNTPYEEDLKEIEIKIAKYESSSQNLDSNRNYQNLIHQKSVNETIIEIGSWSKKVYAEYLAEKAKLQ